MIMKLNSLLRVLIVLVVGCMQIQCSSLGPAQTAQTAQTAKVEPKFDQQYSEVAAVAQTEPNIESEKVIKFSLPKIFSEFQLHPGNIDETLQSRFIKSALNSSIQFVVPPLNSTQYSQGFRFRLPELNKIAKGDFHYFVYFKAKASHSSRNKDLITLRDDSGKILSHTGIGAGTHSYFLSIPDQSDQGQVTLVLLEQNLDFERELPLEVELLELEVVGVQPELKTADFISNMKIEKYIEQGLNFDIQLRSPLRDGSSLSDLSSYMRFDYAELSRVERKLLGVDRAKVLKAIFNQLTIQSTDSKSKFMAVLDFLQRASFHNSFYVPIYADETMVTDPLVVLEMGGELQCGNVARLGVDLFEAGGYKARLIQFANHQSAEVFMGDKWRLLEADLFGNAEIVTINGDVPSVDELSAEPFLIDSYNTNMQVEYLKHSFLTEYQKIMRGPDFYPSCLYFRKQQYELAKHPPIFYEKEGSPANPLYDRLYGWGNLKTVANPERKLYGGPCYTPPLAPEEVKIQIAGDAKKGSKQLV